MFSLQGFSWYLSNWCRTSFISFLKESEGNCYWTRPSPSLLSTAPPPTRKDHSLLLFHLWEVYCFICVFSPLAQETPKSTLQIFSPSLHKCLRGRQKANKSFSLGLVVCCVHWPCFSFLQSEGACNLTRVSWPEVPFLPRHPLLTHGLCEQKQSCLYVKEFLFTRPICFL